MNEARLNKLDLLQKLEHPEPEKSSDRDEDQFRQMSMARALRTLAQIDHEREYRLCRTVAEHILGKVPEPDRVAPEE